MLYQGHELSKHLFKFQGHREKEDGKSGHLKRLPNDVVLRIHFMDTN